MQGSAAREIELIIRGLSRAQSRIWVIDWQRNLLATAGSLRPDPDTPQEEDPPGVFEWIEVHALEPLYSKLLETPSKGLPDIVSEAGFSSGREVDSALGGIPASRWYNTSDNQIALLSAAHPIWIGEKVMGAVIVVESTLPVLSVRYRAFEQLLTATLLVFLLGAGTLFAFASRLSSRLANLRSEAESAIDPQGRVKGLVKGSNARDEIGDLARSFSTMLERLAQYNAYLERMADRLSHELRTPVAIVSSSLDNLKLQPLPDAALTYIDRAEQGLRRLNVIFTRMREASRLEQMLRDAERERFDLTHVVAGCGAGYASAFPEHRFDLELPSAPVWLTGAPDAIAQMLDKIVENAVDFSHELAPIRISVQQSFGESMISVRDGLDASGASPHLGLGLFMVRLIAEFHHATARAENRPDGRGVIVEVTFPAEYTPEAEERPRRPPREAGLESA
jgi:signal transduction histidine kinase